MLNILIVDDEPVVRRGLRTIINWQEYNCDICGEASNGMEGLRKLEEYKPDVVMVDIKMPEMDGLVFIEHAKQMNYDCKFIILSGYNDFNYAQRAIRSGVNAYLLKPIEENELIGLLVKFQKEIEEDKKKKSAIDDGIRFVINETIKSLINNEEITNQDYKNCIYSYDNFKEFNVAIVKILSPADKVSKDFLKKCLSYERSVEIYDINGENAILFCDNDKKSINRILNTISRNVKRQFNKKVFIVLGRNVKDIRDISVSYAAAKSLIDNHFFYGYLGIAYWEELIEQQGEEIINIEQINYSDIIEKLYVAIEISDMSELKKSIENLALTFKKNVFSAEKAKGIYANIILEVLKKTEEAHTSIKGIYSHDIIMHDILEMDNILEVKKYIFMLTEALAIKISNTCSDVVIKRIIDYVNKNYDKELKVETLASRFNYSNAYLGQMFKSYTGEYFNSYVDRLRIENAKRFLIDGFKATEVAEKVGFKSKDYFYNKFKKHVGVGPSEYRKVHMQN